MFCCYLVPRVEYALVSVCLMYYLPCVYCCTCVIDVSMLIPTRDLITRTLSRATPVIAPLAI